MTAPLAPPEGYPRILGTVTWRDHANETVGPGVSIEDGRLVLRGRGASSITGHALTRQGVRDVIVDTVMRASGTGPDEGFGVIVRQSTPQRYIAWRITTARVILISAMDGIESPLAAGTLAEGIELHTDAGAPNRFTVVACGPALTFILNDMIVTSVLVDPRYVDGHAGVALEQRHAESKPELAVEWFQVRSILPDQADTGVDLTG